MSTPFYSSFEVLSKILGQLWFLHHCAQLADEWQARRDLDGFKKTLDVFLNRWAADLNVLIKAENIHQLDDLVNRTRTAVSSQCRLLNIPNQAIFFPSDQSVFSCSKCSKNPCVRGGQNNDNNLARESAGCLRWLHTLLNVAYSFVVKLLEVDELPEQPRLQIRHTNDGSDYLHPGLNIGGMCEKEFITLIFHESKYPGLVEYCMLYSIIFHELVCHYMLGEPLGKSNGEFNEVWLDRVSMFALKDWAESKEWAENDAKSFVLVNLCETAYQRKLSGFVEDNRRLVVKQLEQLNDLLGKDTGLLLRWSYFFAKETHAKKMEGQRAELLRVVPVRSYSEHVRRSQFNGAFDAITTYMEEEVTNAIGSL